MTNEKKTHRVSHTSRPAEPWGQLGAIGRVLRVTPSGRMIPAQAYIEWVVDESFTYHTWERCKELRLFGEYSWAQVMEDTRHRKYDDGGIW